MASDEKVGYEMLTKWLRLRVCLSNLGALVRLVREIIKKADAIIQAGDDVEPDIIAWLSEAKALVGEGTGKE